MTQVGDKNMVRVDMNRPQTLSSGAANYMLKSLSELDALAEKAGSVLKDLAFLEKDPKIFNPQSHLCLAPKALPSELNEMLGLESVALCNASYEKIIEKVSHILRMSRKAREIKIIRKDKIFNQSMSRILWGGEQKKFSSFEEFLWGKARKD